MFKKMQQAKPGATTAADTADTAGSSTTSTVDASSPKKSMARFEIDESNSTKSTDSDHSHGFRKGLSRLDSTGQSTRDIWKRRTSEFLSNSMHWPVEIFKPHGDDDKNGAADMLGTLILVAVYYCMFLFLMGEDLLHPGGKMFVLLLIWFCSHVGAFFVEKAGLPPLLGMLIAGMILVNLKMIDGMENPIEALPSSWSEGIRASGLCVILMRSGLELDIPAVQASGMAAVRLTLLPGIVEAFTIAFTGIFVFKMSFALSLCMGFILAAVSPAVVVVGMFNLQKKGYGVIKGIPSLVVAAASFDDVVAISGFSIAFSFAVPSLESHSTVMTLLHGPLEIIFGVLLGFAGGYLISFTKIWNKRWKRTAVVLGLGLMMMFGMLRQGFSGAGAMGGLIMGMVGSVNWRAGTPVMMSKRADEHYIHHAESDLALIWSMVCQPLLFGVIGSALDFTEIPVATIPKAILVVFCGLCTRLPIAYFATYGKGLTTHERGFIALSWIPKATVQAALCAVPLDRFIENWNYRDCADEGVGGTPEIAMKSAEYISCMDEYDQDMKWGYDILTTAVLGILLTAPLGLIFIQVLGPKWLSHDVDEESSAGGGGEVFGAQMSKDDKDFVETIEKKGIVELQDLKDVMDEKLHEIEDLVILRKGHLTKEDAKVFTKNMFQIKKIADLCVIDMGGKKLLDTAGNFFKLTDQGKKAGERKARSTSNPEVQDPTSSTGLVNRKAHAETSL